MFLQKKIIISVILLALLMPAIQGENLLLKKKHAAPKIDSDSDIENIVIRHDPFNKAAVLQMIDKMECRKINTHDYEVNL